MGFLGKIGKPLSAINPVANIAGQFFDSFSGRSQQEDANKMAMLSWNLANDYNHPLQQMQRLREAGLNPLLVYGSGSVSGNTTGAPSLVGGGISTSAESVVGGLSNIMGVLQGNANLQNTRAQTQASTAAAGASSAQASNLQAQAAYNETRNQFAEKSMIADLDYKRAQTKLTNAQIAKTSAEADLAQGEANIFGAVGGTHGAQALAKGGSSLARMGNSAVRMLRGLTR